MAVGVHAFGEVPPQVVDAADVVLDSPLETARFLAALARALVTPRSAEGRTFGTGRSVRPGS
jgi:hypothetical protein